jgi:hypothetical protein
MLHQHVPVGTPLCENNMARHVKTCDNKRVAQPACDHETTRQEFIRSVRELLLDRMRGREKWSKLQPFAYDAVLCSCAVATDCDGPRSMRRYVKHRAHHVQC